MEPSIRTATISTNKLYLFSALVLSVYAGLMTILAKMEGAGFSNLILFIPLNYSSPTILNIFKLIAFLDGVLMFLLPGIIWSPPFKQSYKNWTEYFGTVIAGSITICVCLAILYKLFTPLSVTRISLTVIIALTCIAGVLNLIRLKISAITISTQLDKKDKSIRLITGLLLVICVFGVFHEKIIHEDMNGDGLEVFEVSRSLDHYIFNYTHYDQFAPSAKGQIVNNPNFLGGYIYNFALNLFGDSASSIKMLYPVLLLWLFFIILSLIGHTKSRVAPITVGGYLFLFTVIMFFYTSNLLHFVDIVSDSVKGVLFVSFSLLSIYFLINMHRLLFVIYAIFASLILYSGPVFTFCFLLGCFMAMKNNREFVLKSGVTYVIGLLLIVGIFLIKGYFTESLGNWGYTLKIDIFDEYIRDVNIGRNSLADMLLFLKYFVIFAGGVPILGLFLKRSKQSDGAICIATIGFLLFFLLGSHKNIHYFMPIAALPLILLLKNAKKIGAIMGLVSVAALIVLSWPKIYRPHLDYQLLGQDTCLMFDSYEDAKHMNSFLNGLEREACRNNSLMCDGASIWDQDSVMTWLYYADTAKNCKKEYEIYFTADNIAPRDNIRLYASNNQYYIWSNRNIDNERLITPTEKDIFSNLFHELVGRY